MSDVISFSCDQCENIFPTSKKLMAHVRKADNHEAICKACDKQFNNFDNMRIHKRKYHYEPSEFGEFVCDSCGNSYKTKELLRNHNNVVHKIESGLKCNLCRKPLQNMLKLKRHMRMCLLTDQKIEFEETRETDTAVGEIYQSDSIELSGESISSIGMNTTEEIGETVGISEQAEEVSDSSSFHKIKREEEPIKNVVQETAYFESKKQIVEDEYAIKTDQLDFIFDFYNSEQNIKMEKKNSNISSNSEEELKPEHIQSENSNPQNMGFSTQRKLKHHMITSHEGKTIVCDICSKVSKNKHAHRYHQRRIHEKLKDVPKVPSKKVNVSNTENPVCNHCEKVFGTPRKLKHHIITAHKGEPVMCNECSKTFKNKHAHRNHQRRIHEKPDHKQKVAVKTKICPICAKDVKYLNRHIEVIHTENLDENHRCISCSKVFKSIRKLKSHMATSHTVQPAMCDSCSQVFKNKAALRNHKRRVHEEQQDVNCPSCFKSFGNKTKLYFHERAVHTAEASTCQVCGKTYKNRNLLQKHVKVYHRNLDHY